MKRCLAALCALLASVACTPQSPPAQGTVVSLLPTARPGASPAATLIPTPRDPAFPVPPTASPAPGASPAPSPAAPSPVAGVSPTAAPPAFQPSLPPLGLQSGTPYGLEQYIQQVVAQGVAVARSTREYRPPWFVVPGTAFDANGEQVLVFVYPNPEARERDAAKISADGKVIAGEERPWPATPHFYSRGNIIVQFVSNSEETAAKLKSALDSLP